MKTNFKNSYRYFIRHLREKHRFSIRNQHTDTEVWYIYISPLNVLAGLLALVLVLFIMMINVFLNVFIKNKKEG